MKKVLLVMLIPIIAVSAAFAKFNKEDLSLNVRMGFESYGMVGVSYDLDEDWSIGLEAVNNFCISRFSEFNPSNNLISLFELADNMFIPSVSYNFINNEKSALSAGFFMNFELDEYIFSPFSDDFGFQWENLGAEIEYAYSFNEHNAITARVLLTWDGNTLCEDLKSWPTIGYKYSF